jgi:glutathione synthase/RimK-type ligase-like ATP-grasp enzyme
MGHRVINWGNSSHPNWDASNCLNAPSAVAKAAHKLKTFLEFRNHNVPSPEFTTNTEEANQWIEQGHRVYCRKTLTGKGGDGIIVARSREELVVAPMYTKGVNAVAEYRVHVFNGEVIDTVKKARRNGESPNEDIRNHTQGWIFMRGGVEVSLEVRNAATEAVRSLGLDFGAVDVCKDANGTPYVLEVNTAPGIEGTTLSKYEEAITQWIANYR